MSDVMRPISIDALLDWVMQEYKKTGTIFGIRRFYKADKNKRISLFNEKVEVPFGPAAGPQTQLAQNIVAAYVSGARFFELKTVQVIDGEDTGIAKPCISARDEAYNSEWSTELRVPQAFEEYTKAWFVLKLLSREFDLGDPDGFIFNMSVGYDLEGILTPKIQKYIHDMQDVSNTPIWEECLQAARKHMAQFTRIDEEYLKEISPHVSRSITLSTLHGCPPDEIEKIATHFIEKQQLHTFIKCNPTLLGYDYAREIMNKLGFDYMEFDDHHFVEDLQFEEAVPMLKRLQSLADRMQRNFGVKITNTLPVDVGQNELPADEMFMSGRSLFPLSIAVAKKLSDAFLGKLQISYSGGADIFNIKDLFEAGIWPITVATTLLKPGGYQRIQQMSNVISSLEYPNYVQLELDKLTELVEKSKAQALYQKPIKLPISPKIKEKLPLLDCYTAPCRGTGGCPIDQDIPAYLRYVSEGKHLEALKVIVDKNPLPFITGTICAHPCQTKCTRQFYEDSIDIRGVKLEAAENAYDELMATMEKPERKENVPKTAVVGGGPAGISAGYLLAREGYPVTVFEKGDDAGGVCSQIVPEFRISMESVQRDVDMAKFMGAEFKTGEAAPAIDSLKEAGYENVIYAIGAHKHNNLRLDKGEAVNSLEFLSDLRVDPRHNVYGEDIVVIGGGNTAMDCARAAKRLPGVNNVSLVYRRDKRNMPADEEELLTTLDEGVTFRELLSPVSLENGYLTCEVMKLGKRDESGRKRPESTGQFVDIKASTVVSAIGEKVDDSYFNELGIQTDPRGRVLVNPDTLETNLEHVYVVGDAHLGPATIVEAIADATKACSSICEIHNKNYERANQNIDLQEPRSKRGILLTDEDPVSQAERCLECSTICESCVDVCPNRANVVINVNDRPQIMHIDRMCNECGNCETFCPYSSAPYKVKFTLFNSEEDFYNSTNQGFYVIDQETKTCLVRYKDKEQTVDLNTTSNADIADGIMDLMETVIDDYDFCLAN
ncbi:putative selenate reductase subunit YgfK [Tetragenococcus halophilus subsp. flandriensis]|uniref:putative selenate reductase subunit YgfK n=1 Tax=Tetragenococcus halophilus TaxID=51669 RepID=UPI0023E9F898|nr:putative selenate reductase subunit YgfK [Tetragenococcus halophilus]GMA07315.1 putative selenate reductase subunit YgfK [Tetragenococcus halophilus subsp. flandriensis]